MYVYEMGQMIVARGSQCVFSSIQLWPGVPAIWKDKPAVYKGKISNRKYGEFEREVRLLFKAFLEVFYEGDAMGKPFSFPKPELVISKEFLDEKVYDAPKCDIRPNEQGGYSWGEIIAPSYRDLYRLAFKLALHNGSPYFESQYHVDNPLNSIQCMQCCSYGFQADADSDKEFYNKLNFIDGAHFDNLGSMQVVSLNLPRAAYIAKQEVSNWSSDKLKLDDDEFKISIKYLRELVNQCVRIFEIKRNSVRKQASPFMRQTPMDPNDPSKHAPSYTDLEKLSYVVGLVGLNEYVQALTGKQLHESPEAEDLGLKLVAALNLYCGKVGHAAGMQIALARTPAETTAQRFAVSDLINYPEFAKKYVKGNVAKAEEILAKGESKDLPIEYSNGTHCSVSAPISLQKKAEVEGKFFEILKGGNIFHIFLSDVNPFLTLDSVVDENCQRIPKEITEQDIDTIMDFGMNLVKNTPITYFAFSKDMTICLDCHATSTGILDKCPKCNSSKVDHIARITGYYSSESGWNEAKKQELRDRNRYNVENIKG
jgi:ribonucleoside-triphosphate reductase